jgi:hypothetical protein
MHQYGQEGFCLVWSINNALQRKLLTSEEVVEYLKQEDQRDEKKTIKDFIAIDGIDFMEFREFLREKYGIRLKKVNNIVKSGRYLVTYDFGDYYHTVAVYNGKVYDSRKRLEIKTLDTRRKLVDIYKLNL